MTYTISFDIHPDFSNIFGVRVYYNLLEGKWVGEHTRGCKECYLHGYIQFYFSSMGIKRLKAMFGEHLSLAA